jgi:hypothetical protein
LPNEWSERTDDELAHIAQDGMQGQGAPVEAMRRLRVAIEKSSAQSDIYSRRMFWLTIILTVMTFVQVIAVIPVIIAAIRWLLGLSPSPAH